MILPYFRNCATNGTQILTTLYECERTIYLFHLICNNTYVLYIAQYYKSLVQDNYAYD